jgi:thymidine phosphorylase
MANPHNLPEHPRPHTLRLRRLGIDTHQELVVYMRQDCHICRSEGFAAQARIQVTANGRSIIATLGKITSDLLGHGEASLSESAWRLLGVSEGSEISFSHPPIVESLGLMRGKIYGQRLDLRATQRIIEDIVAGRYADVHLSAFITACSGRALNRNEMAALTRAMVITGTTLDWGSQPIADKHCIGGLPGNRTTPIVVGIAAACGLIIPKTSSRAITSPAGTADTMETMTNVDLDVAAMRRVVEREGGCLVWGGAVDLSPADDILIRVERLLDLDSEGQMVASVLSKKIAAGATHVVLDLPVGPTAKLRTPSDGHHLTGALRGVAEAMGLQVRVILTDGTQPVGRGVGPALEAQDVLAVLRNDPAAPQDLCERAIGLSASLLELVLKLSPKDAQMKAHAALENGSAWRKFEAICNAQGGLREPPRALHTHPVLAEHNGVVVNIDNRVLAKIAKLAGAPNARAAGLEFHTPLGVQVEKGMPLFTVHAESRGELAYALEYVRNHPGVVRLEADA